MKVNVLLAVFGALVLGCVVWVLATQSLAAVAGCWWCAVVLAGLGRLKDQQRLV
ncbi:MAG: hypothetical protein IT429_17035 [Gemmataceae bacterium]|nr:hypothetical protein [Gemmataceae bacterium]